MPPPKAFVEDRMIASAAALGLVARRYSKQLNISFCFALLYLVAWDGTLAGDGFEGDLLPKCSRTLPLRSNGSVTPFGGGRAHPRKNLWRTA